MPYRIDLQICFRKPLWLVYNWLDVLLKLSFQFINKSMMQEVLSPLSCRDLWTSCTSRYSPFISYDLPTELLQKWLFFEEAHRFFIKRYVKRNNFMPKISSCDAEMRSALDMFHVCIPLWFIIIYISLLPTALCFNSHSQTDSGVGKKSTYWNWGSPRCHVLSK